MRVAVRCSVVLGVMLGGWVAPAAQRAPSSQTDAIAWWRFDDGAGSLALDTVSGTSDSITGNWWKFVPGISGTALKLDGFTTALTRPPQSAPRLGGALTIETWIALAAYPWARCPVASQETEGRAGYFFGVYADGHVGLELALGGRWMTVMSTTALKTREWYHLAATFDPAEGLSLYINGRLDAQVRVMGDLQVARDVEFMIGRSRLPVVPQAGIRPWATLPSWFALDAALDELRIHDTALSREAIRVRAARARPTAAPPLPERRFPTGPGQRGLFGAVFGKLDYYEEWDALWRVASDPDLVVNFDRDPIRMVFWRGTRYSPAWVTENGRWMADQSLETMADLGDGRTVGSIEHMADKIARYSHVRVIENTAARVVVHWRYALTDVRGRQAYVDPLTSWGDWGDEYYTIYPDGVAVRKVHHWTRGGEGKAVWQETIFLSQAGTRPEDNAELEAITLTNLRAESRSYSWEAGTPHFDLDDAVIQVVNLKSQYRPFMVVRPGTTIQAFEGETRPAYSHFPWWNHWPAAQIASDGRYALSTDQPSHSSLSSSEPVGNVALYGLTNKDARFLVTLAASWIRPPALAVTSGAATGAGYDVDQRAYVITAAEDGPGVDLRLEAREDQPLLNPGLVVRNWGDAGVVVKIDGAVVPQGPNVRVGRHRRLSGVDLIVWLDLSRTSPVRVELVRAAD